MIELLAQVDPSNWKTVSDAILEILGDWWAFALPILGIFFPKVRQLGGAMLIGMGNALTPNKYKEPNEEAPK